MINESNRSASVLDIVELCGALDLAVCQNELRGGIAALKKGYRLAVVILPGEGREKSRVALAEWGQVKGEVSGCSIPGRYHGQGLSVAPTKKAPHAAYDIASVIRFQSSGGPIGRYQDRDAWLWPVTVRDHANKVQKVGSLSLSLQATIQEIADVKREALVARDEVRRAKGLETSQERRDRKAASRPKKAPSPKRIASAIAKAKKLEDRGTRMLRVLVAQTKKKKASILRAVREIMRPIPKMERDARATVFEIESRRLRADVESRKEIARGMISSITQHEAALRESIVGLRLPGFSFRPIDEKTVEMNEAKLLREVESPRERAKWDRIAAKEEARKEAAAAKIAKVEAREAARAARKDAAKAKRTAAKVPKVRAAKRDFRIVLAEAKKMAKIPMFALQRHEVAGGLTEDAWAIHRASPAAEMKGITRALDAINAAEQKSGALWLAKEKAREHTRRTGERPSRRSA